MKTLGAVATLSACATGANARTYYCDRPSELYIRSGYSADYDQMERSRRDVESYLDEMNAYLDCLANEHQDARDEAQRALGDWEHTVRQFENR